MIFLALLVVTLLLLEGALRAMRPFVTTSWPSKFDERVGFTFEPGQTLMHTNHVDYWATNRVNSLGFLDREPPTHAKSASVCRIAIIGDSFVEAAQVAINDKVQVQLEEVARARLGMAVETMAFGFSGTGQANQLPFYDVFARNFMPDVVILVFVANDLANNSPVLEALRNGWHPDHPPRLFHRRREDGAFEPITIDRDWQTRVLGTPVRRPTRVTKFHQSLLGHSFFYAWLYSQLSTQLPTVASKISPTPDLRNRMNEIENLSGHSDDFKDWNYPNDMDMDFIFCSRDPLPHVFSEAEDLTGHALDEFLVRGERDGFKLLSLLSYGVSTIALEPQFGRPTEPRAYEIRVKQLLDARNIPSVQQYDYIQEIGADVQQAHFTRDGHWSTLGHRWAAESIAKLLARQPDLCPQARAPR